MTLKTYLFPEVAANGEITEWVPADVARELFVSLKSIMKCPLDIDEEGSLVLVLGDGEDHSRAFQAIKKACDQ